MGVSGCGKSTIGKLLAQELNIPFFDGDDFHPEKNIAKMSSGQALNDDDRFGWLQTLNKLAIKQLDNKGCVIVCFISIISYYIYIVMIIIFLNTTLSASQIKF